MHQGIINIRNFRMHYEIYDGVLQQDTLFIHGNLASNRWWLPALRIWHKTNNKLPGRAILAEWRGCGNSDRPYSDDDLQLEILADDYIALLQSLECKQVDVVGHSLGGLIALYAMRMAPKLFNKAILLDPVGAKGIQFPPAMTDAFIEMTKNRSFTEAVIAGTIYQCDPANKDFQDLIDDAYKAVPLVGLGVLKVLEKLNFTAEVDKILHQILVLHGEHDQLLPKQDSLWLAEHLPNARFYEIPGQGHSTNFENPEKFVALVDDFFNQEGALQRKTTYQLVNSTL